MGGGASRKTFLGLGGGGLKGYEGRMPSKVWGANAPQYSDGSGGRMPPRIQGGWGGESLRADVDDDADDAGGDDAC